MNMLRVKMPNIILSLQENRFTKCDHCTNYKKQLEATMNKGKRKAIQELLDEHIELVM